MPCEVPAFASESILKPSTLQERAIVLINCGGARNLEEELGACRCCREVENCFRSFAILSSRL